MTIRPPSSGAAPPAPLFSELKVIAASVAGRVDDLHSRRDVYQEAWRRFVQYPPRTYLGAWLMANSARDSLYKRERTQRRVKDSAPSAPTFELDAVVGARATLRDMAGRFPRALRFMLGYIRRTGHSGADRRMAHYYRQQLRACL